MSEKRTKQARRVLWSDQEIRDLKGRRYYLRAKYNRSESTATLSIKTHRNGKGLTCATVFIAITSENSVKEAAQKLVKKWRKFYFVQLTPAWEV